MSIPGIGPARRGLLPFAAQALRGFKTRHDVVPSTNNVARAAGQFVRSTIRLSRDPRQSAGRRPPS